MTTPAVFSGRTRGLPSLLAVVLKKTVQVWGDWRYLDMSLLKNTTAAEAVARETHEDPNPLGPQIASTHEKGLDVLLN